MEMLDKGFCTIACIFLATGAQAFPIVFEFDLPDWEVNSSTTLFGTDAIIQVTVDNGFPSLVDQRYDNSEILSVIVHTSGTYSNSWSADDISEISGPSGSFISTTGLGIPLLNLQPYTSERVVFGNLLGTWQFGTEPSFTPTWLENGPFFNGAETAYHREHFQQFGVVVPLPTAVWLFGAALGLLGWMKRKA